MATQKSTMAVIGGPAPARKKAVPALTLKQKFDLLAYINAADKATPDLKIAEDVGAAIGRVVLPGLVADYRKQLGLTSVPRPTAAQLQRTVDDLRRYAAALASELQLFYATEGKVVRTLDEFISDPAEVA